MNKLKKRNYSFKRQQSYDSKLELVLQEGPLQTWEYHPMRIPYFIEKTYEPDFVKTIDGVQFLCEVKGVWWDSAEAKKYKELVKHLRPNQILFFIFQDYNKPLLWSKRRKDGTKMTHLEYCEKNGLICFDVKDYHSSKLKSIATKVNMGVKFYDNHRYCDS